MAARTWLALVGCLGACGSSPAEVAHPLHIDGVEPACPVAGATISLFLSGGHPEACETGRVFAGSRELTNLGLVTRAPWKLAARLPAGLALARGDELRVVCGSAAASTYWNNQCLPDAGPPDARAGDEPADAAPFCGEPIEAVIEAVDKAGRPFPADPAGVFLVPINADDFAFDTGKSRHVSTHDVLYTFSSDCFPRVTVRAPVLGGFSTQGFWLEKRCQFMVEIADLGCPGARQAQAQAAFRIVPAP